MKAYKVIFHIDEENKWQILISNVNNLINDMNKENLEIEILANGSAVKTYINNEELINKMKVLSGVGVRLVACRNSLRGNSINEEKLPRFIKVVPAGVSELIKKQDEGYSYIKP